MSQPIKLYRTLFILQKSESIIQRIADRTRVVKDGQLELIADSNILVDNAVFMILELTNLLDEYDNKFQEVEKPYRERVLVLKTICKPILKQIRNWKDLTKVRNLFIAHNCRDKSGNFYVPDLLLYDVPKSALEFHVISDYLKYLMQLVLAEFGQEMNEALLYMFQFVKPPKKYHDVSNLNSSLEEMQRQ
jgi:hypothetical protein